MKLCSTFLTSLCTLKIMSALLVELCVVGLQHLWKLTSP